MTLGIGELLLIAIAISLDNFAAALALGSLGQARRRWLIAAVFGLFGAAAPLLGIWLGQELAGRLADYAAWLGIGILTLLGLWTLVSGLRDRGADERMASRVTTGWGLVVLAASLSIDNLAAGFGLGLYGAPPLPVALASGGVVACLTFLGVTVGNSARRRWERWTQVLAGLFLLGLAAALGLGWF